MASYSTLTYSKVTTQCKNFWPHTEWRVVFLYSCVVVDWLQSTPSYPAGLSYIHYATFPLVLLAKEDDPPPKYSHKTCERSSMPTLFPLRTWATVAPSRTGRKSKGERIGSSRNDRYVVRWAQILGVDSQWRDIWNTDIWDPKAGTGDLFCPGGCRGRMMLPGGCSSESKMLISLRRREQFRRVPNRFGWNIPKILG